MTTSGGTASTCYKLTVFTNVFTSGLVCNTTGSSFCSVNSGSGAYASGSTIQFKVEKTCNTATREHVNYIVQGHL